MRKTRRAKSSKGAVNRIRALAIANGQRDRKPGSPLVMLIDGRVRKVANEQQPHYEVNACGEVIEIFSDERIAFIRALTSKGRRHA